MNLATRLALVGLLAAGARTQSFPAHGLVGIGMDPWLVESSSFAADDLDGDGHVDFIAASTQPGQSGVVVRLGFGDGSFAPPVLSPGAAGERLLVGQFTSDALRDVLTLDSFSEHVELATFAGTGAAALSPPVTSTIWTVGALYADTALPVAADLNGDGVQDVLMLTNQHEVVAAFATGSGGFVTAATFVSANGLAKGAADLDVADTDADGDLDVLVLLNLSGPGKPRLQVIRNAGNGSFTPLAPTTAFGATLTSGGVADFDADGKPDLVVSTGVGRALVRGLGQNDFELEGTTPGDSMLQPFVADLDADGSLDVAGAESYGHSVLIDLATSAFAFETLGPQVIGSVPHVLGLRDADGDGVPDLLAATSKHADGLLARGRGDGSFIVPRRVAAPAAITALAGGDVDGDGDVDVFACGPSGVSLAINETGVLDQASPILALVADELAAGDLDGDGRCDLVGGGPESYMPLSTSLSLPVSGAPAFGAPQTLGTGGVERLVLADLDLDGHLDLVAARPDAQIVDVFHGLGTGGFASPTSLHVDAAPVDAAVADLDGDGKLDLVLAAGKIEWLPGLGNGGFASALTLATPHAATGVAVTDLDGDGRADLVMTGPDDLVDTFVGTGGGGFAQAGSAPIFAKAYRVLVADLDRDGRPDVLAPAFANARISLLQGLGNGQLAPEQRLIVRSYASGPVVADLDGDGWLDLATPAEEPNEVWTHPNLHSPFTDLGFAHAAPFGAPELRVAGLPAPGGSIRFEVTGLPAADAGPLVFGLGSQHKSFKGGVLVPVPQFAIHVHPGTPIAGAWPPLPAGTTVFAQAWFAAGGSFAGSNAVEIVAQ